VLTWPEFARARPDLADAGRALCYQYGVGLAFLATVDRYGGPRVHPVCPLISDDGLFVFVIPSPKRNDLHRDGRFALHTFPAEANEDAFSAYGRAAMSSNAEQRDRLGRQFRAEREDSAPSSMPSDWELFEFRLNRCLLTRTTGHGDPAPRHSVWRAAGARRIGRAPEGGNRPSV
jgi:hypothetical protein